jgi:hypothetical protein
MQPICKIEVELNLSESTLALFSKLIGALAGPVTHVTPSPVIDMTKPEKATKTTKAEKPAKEEKAPETDDFDFNTPITPDDFDNTPQIEITAAQIKEACKAKGPDKKPGVMKLIAKHGGSSIPTIPVENYAAFMADLAKL